MNLSSNNIQEDNQYEISISLHNRYHSDRSDETYENTSDVESLHGHLNNIVLNETLSNNESVINNECRICFEIEEENNPLISPCKCNGFSKYVHRNCIEKWRLLNRNSEALTKCMECGSHYEIENMYTIETHKYTDEYISRILNNSAILIINLFSIFMAMFARGIDKFINFRVVYLLDSHPLKSFISLIKNDTLYCILFYYGIIITIIGLCFYTLFIIKNFLYIQNKLLYWKKIIICIMIRYIIALYIGWIYYICKYYIKSGNELCINWIVIISYVHLYFCREFLIYHNKIIDNMNSRNIGKVKNIQENIQSIV